jgi:glutamate synthase (NADPH/NADH) large chain/glutamate synthase (ferredoxin)
VLQLALESVANVTHRGAVGADARTGDGAGVLTQMPRAFFARELTRLGVTDFRPQDVAVAMFFFPSEEQIRARCQGIVERTCDRHGLRRLAWRPVPVDPEGLGDKARATQPDIQQLIIGRPLGMDDNDFERVLFLARKEIERRVTNEGIGSFYVPSMSPNTVVYKGLVVPAQLAGFYRDLADPLYETALAVFHQRYSTNTFPTWFLAQPFRMLAHNGEINTEWGNRNWMAAREPDLASPIWNADVEWLKPICWNGGSDSAGLDNALEAIERSGRDVLHTMMMLVPEAWEHMADMDAARRAFYEYHSCLTEPWDGPAALAFSDGRTVAAALDRNGLRPARYKVTRDGLVVMGSEVGMVEIDDADVVEKGRLGPGEMIAVDTRAGRLLRNAEIKGEIAARRPYGEWLARRLVRLETRLNGEAAGHAPAPRVQKADLPALWRAFGWTQEDVREIVTPMAAEGLDPKWSMGDDAPIAALSGFPRPLYSYFRQRFAQVTNPPIDPLLEGLVMSLDTYLGRRGNLFAEAEEHARLVHVPSPILLDDEMAALSRQEFGATVLPVTYDPDGGEAGLDEALKALCRAAVAAVDGGSTLLILTDLGVRAGEGGAAGLGAIPALLATGAVHHHLIREGKRMRADLIVQTGEAWDIHHLACLIGYGAGAVHPYLALAASRAFAGQRGFESTPESELEARYRKAADKGLLRIMSKMGISAVSSYRGAQIFEAVGVSQALIDRCFNGTPSRIGGIGLPEVAQEVLRRYDDAFRPDQPLAARLPDMGFIRYKKDGEFHGYNRLAVVAMQKAARSGEWDDYVAYRDLMHAGSPRALRDVLDLVPLGPAVPVDEVEPVENIIARFSTQAMSLGALSPEAHATLAVAMNRIGAKSNTGEGGEDPAWWKPFPDGPFAGERANSKGKQVAAARFGVTPEYLQHAEELEIKIAQGAKPGEGGQLPAHKVTGMIARLRHAIPGIPLISPPPHHDIYSIEDLAQLIYDLKTANPRARVGVKLVAESGVGTIAAGVAKAYADYVLISGHDGGTGASPLSSIKNAGCPWEIGLAETQQVLVMNDLRGRVRLRTDGGLKTGRDVLVAALLGAEEFGFGTAAVIAIGCDMARQCHLNTCPTGIATQREDLRAKFTGTPEQVIHFFYHVAQDVRLGLAALGARTIDEVVGRSDLLRQKSIEEHPRARLLDLSAVLAQIDPEGRRPRRSQQARNDRTGYEPLDDAIIPLAMPALERGEPVSLSFPIRNSQRTVGARLSGEIARRHGDAGLPDGTVRLRFNGSAGQSFGAFLAPGVQLILQGEANDYVGKGMHGGEIAVFPPARASFSAFRNTIAGNTVLYGATGGSLYVAGRAGERFAVRNSGAQAVVEGTGDHCCEYMTGGTVVVLGETGRNFAAGMSHGLAFVLDEHGTFPQRVNRELVSLERLEDTDHEAELRRLIERHSQLTGSGRAEHILHQWSSYRSLFWAVVPHPPQVDTETPARPAARTVAARTAV